LLAIDHPWINEYFSGPRGRAARRGHDKHNNPQPHLHQPGRS
jgi:phospholipid/cholesterol/gamma-HCH transport system ATP-binding protein